MSIRNKFSEQKVTQLKYQDRQLITINPDPIIDEASQEIEEKETIISKEDNDESNIFNEFSRNILSILKKQSTPNLISEPIYILAKSAYDSWKKSQSSSIPILPISTSQSQDLTFPPGHPKYGVVYVAHPTKPELYFPMSGFHRFIFEDKVREALDLLMSLGAKSIKIEHISGWSKDFSASLSLPVSNLPATATTEGGKSSKGESEILFEANLPGHDTPVIPDYLYWYHHEPTWQSIARGRVDFGLKDFFLNVSYLDDLGVNAQVKSEILDFGFSIGGNFQDHQATVWKLWGSFADSPQVAALDLHSEE